MNKKMNRLEDKNKMTINIICSEEWNFLFYGEFFKFCGIFPCKNIDFPETIVSKLPKKLEITENLNWKKGIDELPLLYSAIQTLYGNNNDELFMLAEIYCKYDLVHASIFETLPYKTKYQFKKCRLENALDKFEKAYQELRKHRGGYSFQFFMLVCQTKINFLLGMLRIKKKFDGIKLCETAINLSKKYTEPYPFIYGGIIFDQDLNYLAYSENIYSHVVKDFFLNPVMASYVFTRLGRFHSKLFKENKIAISFYKKASELTFNPDASFHHASLILSEAMNTGNYQEVGKGLTILRQLVYEFNQKENLSVIQLDFLVATSLQIFNTYDNFFSHYTRTSNVDFLNEKIDNNKFFVNFFGEDSAEIEKKYLREHLNSSYAFEKFFYKKVF